MPPDFTPEELVAALIQAQADGDSEAVAELLALAKPVDDAE